VDATGRVLVARRPEHVHQGGRWEFPGGKLRPGEGRREGLARELDEELGIRPTVARPLIHVIHDYPERRVGLDVWRVTAWAGQLRPREGQPLAWRAPAELDPAAFPPADRPVITALRLPDRYAITPEPDDRDGFLRALEGCLSGGVRLVQLRARSWPGDRLLELAGSAVALCRDHGAALVVNGDPALARAAGAAGVHLSARALATLERRPLPPSMWVGASCHDAGELARAERLGADFAVLSPVAATGSHPDATPLGWQRFEALVAACRLPVFALGGLAATDLPRAWAHGAQGIAAIRGLWPGETAGDGRG
jgi:8-oxo-dGTP diphosphatase